MKTTHNIKIVIDVTCGSDFQHDIAKGFMKDVLLSMKASFESKHKANEVKVMMDDVEIRLAKPSDFFD